MKEYLKFYIDGQWVSPVEPRTMDIEDPATEETFSRISIGGAADVDKAVAAAKSAFTAYSQTSIEERVELLEKIAAGIQARSEEMASAISQEMGAPLWLAVAAQAAAPAGHFATAAALLSDYAFEKQRGKTTIRKEPIGVCGLITPWNWPANQVACKVAPALAMGCTMVLKPSEIAPVDAIILAEILDEAGVPPGVFNLVNGDGPGVGAAISAHPGIDMLSFTGSTRAGVLISQAAAPDVKRVALELGGKSPNIILPGADLEKAIATSVKTMMLNSGQSCNAPSRLFVPRENNEEAKALVKATAKSIKVQNPNKAEPGAIGPVSSRTQYDKIINYIKLGQQEGATLLSGGVERPEGLDKGYFIRPTVFADATNDMTIAREEIFGPVLTMIPYETVDQAVAMANDTEYGLSGYVHGPEDQAKQIANRIRAGQIHINGADMDFTAPFGGYKKSGVGREWGEHGFEEFLEVKALLT